jgi:hypothetical protein
MSEHFGGQQRQFWRKEMTGRCYASNITGDGREQG